MRKPVVGSVETLERRLCLSAHLITDINSSGSTGGGGLPTLVNLNSNTALFSYDDKIHGNELWITDGTQGGTSILKEFTPGPVGSGVGQIVATGSGTAYFAVHDSTNQSQLWMTDGTFGGTVLVKDFSVGGFGPISQLTTSANKVYFTVSEATHGEELWVSDGTEPNTVLVEDINPGTSGSSITWITSMGDGRVLFAGTNATAGQEPWVSDGTDPGTFMLADMIAGTGNGSPRMFTLINGSFLFSQSLNLWKTDGTIANTTFVAGSFGGSGLANLTSFGSFGYFSTTPNSGTSDQLYRTDGTALGTTKITNIGPTSNELTAGDFANINGVLYFSELRDVDTGTEPYTSDGTAIGTGIIKDVYVGFPSSKSQYFTYFNGQTYFAANDGTHGVELWKTDGTGANTSQVKDINPGIDPSSVSSFTILNGQLFFVAENRANGIAIWTTDGSDVGTTIAADLPNATQSSGPGFIARASNGLVFFSAINPDTHQLDLWRTDGTAVGTIKLYSGSNFSDVRNGVVIGNNFYFDGTDATHGTELWVSDGSVVGTTMLVDIRAGSSSSSPEALANSNGTLYFAANDGTHGLEPYKSNGTLGNATSLGDLTGGSTSSFPRSFVFLNAFTYFQAGTGLWKTDGTTTTQVATVTINSPLFVSNNAIFFAGSDVTNGVELWKSDGTGGGTAIFGNLATGNANSSPHEFMPFGSSFVFLAAEASGIITLWKSDGTTITEFASTGSEFDLSFDNLAVVGSKIYFIATDVISGAELWTSDGTIGGTHIVQNLRAGVTDAGIEELAAGADGLLYFTANDGTHGQELWATDGSVLNTRLVKDVNPASNSGRPTSLFTTPDGFLYFAADDGTHGIEPWVLEPFAYIRNRILYINGTDDPDPLTVTFTASNSTPQLFGGSFTFNLADFDSVQVSTGDGNDSTNIVASSTITQPFSFDFGAGANSLVANASFTVSSDIGIANTVTVSFTRTVTFTSTQHIGTLTIDGTAIMPESAANVLVVKNLTVNGKLDLNNNDMIVDYDAGTPYATLSSKIQAARGVNGLWAGTGGITSTTAKNAAMKIVTLGLMEASDYKIIYGANAQFDGQTIDNTAVLIKFTYYGDANFSGKVDGGDYARTDQSYSKEKIIGNIGGWINGDFNGDGKVDGSDYGLLDFAFANQGAPIRQPPPTPPTVPVGTGGGIRAGGGTARR